VNDDLTIGLVQLQSSVGDTAGNIGHALEQVRLAAESDCELIVLPEFFNTGYFPIYWDPEHMKLAEHAEGPAITKISEMAQASQCYIIATIYEVARPGEYFDTAFLIGPQGDIVGRYRKTHAPARLSLEKIYFRPAASYPVFQVGAWTVGIAICYDIYFPESVRCLAVEGADLVVAPFADVALPLWDELFQVRAFENLLYVAACNMVGSEGEGAKMTFGGRSLIVDPDGALVSSGDREQEGLVKATLSLSDVYDARRRRHLWRDRNPAAYGSLVDLRNGRPGRESLLSKGESSWQ